MPFDEALTYAVIVIAVIIASSIVAYSMRRRGNKPSKPSPEPERPHADLAGLPFSITKSVSSNDASQAKDELRILDLEREILSDAIRRLYEAQAAGKINEEERERLGDTYKSRMMIVKDAISKDESVVALHELEAMQEDLLKLFSERFDELSGKIEELRQRADTQPIKEILIPAEKTPPAMEAEEKPEGEEKARKRRRPPTAKPSAKTEAEKRIEEIRNEVEKVLDRLGQMEVES